MVFLRLSANGGKTIDVIDVRMAQSLLDQLFMDGKATGKTIISLHDELEKMSAPLPPPGDFCGIWTLSGALQANASAKVADADAQAKVEVTKKPNAKAKGQANADAAELVDFSCGGGYSSEREVKELQRQLYELKNKLDAVAVKTSETQLSAKMDTGEFIYTATARLDKLETQMKDMITVKTSETQNTAQNARLEQFEIRIKELEASSAKGTLENQAAVAEKLVESMLEAKFTDPGGRQSLDVCEKLQSLTTTLPPTLAAKF